MRVTVFQLLNASPVLNRLNEEPLPAKSAFYVSRFVAAIAPDLTRVNDSRTKLFQQFGVERNQCRSCPTTFEKDMKTCPKCGSNGPQLIQTIPPKNEEKFREEFEPLLKSEIEIAAETLSISLIESINLTPREMTSLMPFMTEH